MGRSGSLFILALGRRSFRVALAARPKAGALGEKSPRSLPPPRISRSAPGRRSRPGLHPVPGRPLTLVGPLSRRLTLLAPLGPPSPTIGCCAPPCCPSLTRSLLTGQRKSLEANQNVARRTRQASNFGPPLRPPPSYAALVANSWHLPLSPTVHPDSRLLLLLTITSNPCSLSSVHCSACTNQCAQFCRLRNIVS